MRVGAFQRLIIRRSGHIAHIKRTGIQFSDDRFKGLPIPPVIGKDDKGYGVVTGVRLTSAGKKKLQFYICSFEYKTCNADCTDQDRKEHAPGSGINIQPHMLWISPLSQ